MCFSWIFLIFLKFQCFSFLGSLQTLTHVLFYTAYKICRETQTFKSDYRFNDYFYQSGKNKNQFKLFFTFLWDLNIKKRHHFTHSSCFISCVYTIIPTQRLIFTFSLNISTYILCKLKICYGF